MSFYNSYFTDWIRKFIVTQSFYVSSKKSVYFADGYKGNKLFLMLNAKRPNPAETELGTFGKSILWATNYNKILEFMHLTSRNNFITAKISELTLPVVLLSSIISKESKRSQKSM